MVRVRNTCFN